METKPNKNFNLNNLKKLIKINEDNNIFIVIDRSDYLSILANTASGFNLSDETFKNRILYK